MKKVLLVVIDAFNSWALQPALEQARFATLRTLIQHGGVCWNCVSIFPSITPAATSTIATGCYPATHGVMGAHYYDRDADRVHYFGSDIWVVTNRRFGRFFDDFVHVLNNQCLLAPTIFDHLESKEIQCGSLNYLIFHGPRRHQGLTPWVFRLWPGVPRKLEFQGPTLLCLGDFVAACADGNKPPCDRLHGRGGIWNRFGFCDATTGDLLAKLGRERLPQFTIAYFPDNDFKSHEVGPEAALDTVARVDTALRQFADSWGGVESMLEEVTVIITGDHSQSCTKPAQEDAGIDLSSVLEQYRIVDAGAPWDNGEQLMICPNLRVAQIYLRRDLELDRDRIVELLLQDSRVDQVLWRTGQVAEEVSWYHVASELGQISFRQAEAEGRDDAVVDDFGNWWSFQGDLRVVGAQCHEGRRIEFFDYPNAFERIVGGFDQRYTGDLWVTAKLGFEFSLPRTSIYDAGGSHGSLHRQDSLSPLIVAGYGITGPVPNQCRSVDVAPLCSSLLGHPMPDTDGDLSVFHDMVAERVRK